MSDVLPHALTLEGNGEFPDVDTVRTALALAVRAPSVHNSQPWRWKVGQQSLHLYADPASHLAHSDPDRRDLMVSCGATLHHAVVALSALGWASEVTRLPNPADSNHLASIVLDPRDPDESDISLAAAIPHRRTDRRPFSYWPVPRADLATIGLRTARTGVHLRRATGTHALNAILTEAVGMHLADRDYVRELAAWSGRHAMTVGVPARSTPHPDATAMPSGRVFTGGMLECSPGVDHGVLVALGTTEDDDLSRLRAGEATSIALLSSTALGLASCPVTEPLEIEATREAIRVEVFDGALHPQMMLRIGWAPVGADPLPSTPRRPLGEVVAALDGSALSTP